MKERKEGEDVSLGRDREGESKKKIRELFARRYIH